MDAPRSAGVGSSGAMAQSERDRRLTGEEAEAPRLEHVVARILAETERAVEVYDGILEEIGRSLGWDLGAVWEVDPDDGRLRCARTWQARAAPDEFEALSMSLVLAAGGGLPGRGLAGGGAGGVVGAPEGPHFPRAPGGGRGGRPPGV